MHNFYEKKKISKKRVFIFQHQGKKFLSSVNCKQNVSVIFGILFFAQNIRRYSQCSLWWLLMTLSFRFNSKEIKAKNCDENDEKFFIVINNLCPFTLSCVCIKRKKVNFLFIFFFVSFPHFISRPSHERAHNY